MREHFGWQEAAGSGVPAPCFSRRARGDPQEVIAISAIASPIAFFDVRRDRTSASRQLLSHCPSARIAHQPFAVFPHQVIQEKSLAIREEVPHGIAGDDRRHTLLPLLVCHHSLRFHLCSKSCPEATICRFADLPICWPSYFTRYSISPAFGTSKMPSASLPRHASRSIAAGSM